MGGWRRMTWWLSPGHHRPGTELLADQATVDDEPFAWDLEGNCAFVSAFDYSSAD
jgi:hypothetical protein